MLILFANPESGRESSYKARVGIFGVHGETSMLFGRITSVKGLKVKGGEMLVGGFSAPWVAKKNGGGISSSDMKVAEPLGALSL
jgi:hypothetical protein